MVAFANQAKSSFGTTAQLDRESEIVGSGFQWAEDEVETSHTAWGDDPLRRLKELQHLYSNTLSWAHLSSANRQI